MQDMMKDQERDFKDAYAQDKVLTAREYLGSSGDYLGDLPTVISSKALVLVNKQYRIAHKAMPTGKNPFPEPLSDCNRAACAFENGHRREQPNRQSTDQPSSKTASRP
ncbi:hypothetical protein FocnCong_v015210 [Fusarium oxysporum f. sp. conglutinans]|nr:hypothetical protein FocnCong_v015210 [Fusarium oxysporum f. sp. conglutinans]